MFFKVYVKPVKIPGPGEPEGPDGPEGPEEVNTTDNESGGSSGENPGSGNDGDPDTCFKSDKQDHPWWSLDLGKEWEITAIKVAACNDDRKFCHLTFRQSYLIVVLLYHYI